jgi:hypothetical protein
MICTWYSIYVLVYPPGQSQQFKCLIKKSVAVYAGVPVAMFLTIDGLVKKGRSAVSLHYISYALTSNLVLISASFNRGLECSCLGFSSMNTSICVTHAPIRKTKRRFYGLPSC